VPPELATGWKRAANDRDAALRPDEDQTAAAVADGTLAWRRDAAAASAGRAATAADAVPPSALAAAADHLDAAARGPRHQAQPAPRDGRPEDD